MPAAMKIDVRTADIIRAASRAAEAGLIQEACGIGEVGLADGGDPAALHAMIGWFLVRAQDFEGSIPHLREALARRSADPLIMRNLAIALSACERHDDVLALLTDEAVAADPRNELRKLRAYSAQAAGDFAAAIVSYEQIVVADPSDWESWSNLGNARIANGDFKGSVEALQRAVEVEPLARPTRLNLASALMAAARVDEAEQVLRSAALDFGDDSKPLGELFLLLKEQGRHSEALTALEAAAQRDATDPDLQVKLGGEYGMAKEITLAERAFRRAIALSPRLADAYLCLAIHFEHTNKDPEFDALIALAKRNQLDLTTIAFIEALKHRREQNFDAALECLSLVPEDIEPQRTANIRATLLDRLGRHDDAFAAFQSANRLHEDDPTDPIGRATKLRKSLRDELDCLTPEWVAGWHSATPPSAQADPVFLVGFPRSGTTLLDTMLMGHTETIVMEEEQPLNRVANAIGEFNGISTLDDAGIASARALYFEEAGKICDLDPTKLLVDKSPLFINKVPLIRRLFPKSRLILAMRHPCDVVLSCFMSNFRLNTAMSNFLRLEDAAEFYDLSFRHWERSLSLLPMRVHTIRYERMVDDAEAELRPLFAYLDLEWDDKVLDHSRTARSRALITTASYSQVTEPIYNRAVGRWRRYRKHLEPILPTLAPWAEKFGYEM